MQKGTPLQRCPLNRHVRVGGSGGAGPAKPAPTAGAHAQTKGHRGRLRCPPAIALCQILPPEAPPLPPRKKSEEGVAPAPSKRLDAAKDGTRSKVIKTPRQAVKKTRFRSFWKGARPCFSPTAPSAPSARQGDHPPTISPRPPRRSPSPGRTWPPVPPSTHPRR
jgi:hypothetical protein